MANCCDIDLTLQFDTEAHAEEFHTKLIPQPETETTFRYLYLGTDERQILDPDVTLTGNTIHIVGWVKWAINLEDFMAIVKYAGEFLQQARVKYREDGNMVYGEDWWISGKDEIISKSIDYDHYPKFNQTGSDPDEYRKWYEDKLDVLLDSVLETMENRIFTFVEIDRIVEAKQRAFREAKKKIESQLSEVH